MVSVVKVEPLENYQLNVVLSNGKRGVFDVTPYLDLGVFRELKDPAYFRLVTAAFDGVVWPHEQDFSPETIEYELRQGAS